MGSEDIPDSALTQREPGWVQTRIQSDGPQTEESSSNESDAHTTRGGAMSQPQTLQNAPQDNSAGSQENITSQAVTRGSDSDTNTSLIVSPGRAVAERLEELHLHGTKSGQKRLPEEKVDGDRRVKHSKCSETSAGVFQRTGLYGDAEEDPPEGDTSVLLQPDTQPITAEQLVNEVKGIYSGLVMVEKKCVGIIAQRASTGGKLSNDQWQALIALYRTLLHEHHDFFLASQHPTASPALRRLATKYQMPARMWRNGIHAFLELLRQQLPDSYDHMLAFVYIAYGIMGLLMESVPSFLETWIECLGDLARYRMAIEETDMRDRAIWANAARMWYYKAADRSPNVGRIQHHLGVLARPFIVQQLFYYSKALISVVPFSNARESIMLLFSPFLDEGKAATTFQKYAVIESSLVTAFGILFTRGPIIEYNRHAVQFVEHLDTSIMRMGVKWTTQGVEVASSLVAGLLDYGSDESFLWETFNNNMAVVQARRKNQEETDIFKLEREDAKNREAIRKELWHAVNEEVVEFVNVPIRESGPDDKFLSSDDVTAHVLPLFHQTTSTVAQKIDNRNIGPFMSFILAFLWSLAYIPSGLMYLEFYVPWTQVITFLNKLSRSGVSLDRVKSEQFPQPISGQLPEDFPMRGLIWAQYVFPVAFFRHFVTDEDGRHLELPSHGPPRAERCLWLGMRLASLGRYFTYNVESDQFELTFYARRLEHAKVEMFPPEPVGLR